MKKKKQKSKHVTVYLHGTTVADKVITVIASALKIKKSEIKQTTKIENLPADSLDQVEIVMELEKKFNICIADDKVEELTTVRKIINHVTKAIK
jgi:acyl carrier protein